MTVEKRKTEKRMKRQESHVFIYAYPFCPHTKTGTYALPETSLANIKLT